MSIKEHVRLLSVAAVLVATLLVGSASAESRARIVRLSEVQGTVQIDRGAGDGFEKAFINLPIVEACKLKTGKDGRAEVEFEDGSALRLAPNSEVNFSRLGLGDDGQKLDTVQLVSGTAYANLHPKNSHDKKKKLQENSGDQFQLNFGTASLTVSETAHFRVELNGSNQATLAVFKGKVDATSRSGRVDVAEKHSATIKLEDAQLAKASKSNEAVASENTPESGIEAENSSKSETFVVAKNYEQEPSDAWDQQQTEYHDRYATSGGSNNINSPYSYGMSDLNYYGSFMSLPGYGNVWQPYFIGANWSPFQDGAWAFYPGNGYMWVSGYPWGWMPYAYGSWAFAPGYGWVWEPGYFNTYSGIPRLVNPPVRTKVLTPPTSGRQTVMVGRGLTANPTLDASRRLTISPDSAGFGVPRGAVHHLDHVARNMSNSPRPLTVATAPPPSTASPTGFGTRPSTGSMRGGQSAGMAPMSASHRSAAPSTGPHH